jgi:hypothetical protein
VTDVLNRTRQRRRWHVLPLVSVQRFSPDVLFAASNLKLARYRLS